MIAFQNVLQILFSAGSEKALIKMNSNDVCPACDLTYYKFIHVLIENILLFVCLFVLFSGLIMRKGGKDTKLFFCFFCSADNFHINEHLKCKLYSHFKK